MPQNEKFYLGYTLTQTDFESFSNSVMGICEISLCMSNITPPPLEFLSFLYTLYGQVSGNNSEVDIELHLNTKKVHAQLKKFLETRGEFVVILCYLEQMFSVVICNASYVFVKA